MIHCYGCGGSYGELIMAAFAEGCAGVHVKSAYPKYKGGTTVVWGLARGAPQLVEKAREDGEDWYYVDHGYFKRGHTTGYYRVTKNGHQQDWIRDCPPDRWGKLGTKLHPRRHGSQVIIVPPSASVQAVFGPFFDPPAGQLSKKDGKPFFEKFPDARVVYTYNSIAAVEAIVNGIPCVVTGQSGASPMASKSIDDLVLPADLQHPWACSLAYGQFTLEEMRAGIAWNIVRTIKMT